MASLMTLLILSTMTFLGIFLLIFLLARSHIFMPIIFEWALDIAGFMFLLDGFFL